MKRFFNNLTSSRNSLLVILLAGVLAALIALAIGVKQSVWFDEAYSILAKAMNENSLKQVAAAISGKRTALTPEEARELAMRAVKFKRERGRVPNANSPDPWEKKMAEGATAFVRYKQEGRYEP